jgi:hypothetical protein
LIENVLKFTKVYWFNEMKIKSCFRGASNICLGAKARDRGCLDWMPSFRLKDHLVAASIRKADIA